MNKISSGTLYIVATPIGNPEDITLRAIKVLQSVNAVLCEEYKQGSRIMKSLGVSPQEIIPVNEHNEKEQIPIIIERLLQQGHSFALVSDCGTPVFSDPGYLLIDQVSKLGIPVIPIPGPSSLMAALSILDVNLPQFIFGGFLPRQPDIRRRELSRLKKFNMPIILMDTPYRLQQLMDDIQKIFGPTQRITLTCDLTLPNEKIFRGNVSEIKKQVINKKCEFIIIIH